jgi:hypothetical protein
MSTIHENDIATVQSTIDSATDDQLLKVAPPSSEPSNALELTASIIRDIAVAMKNRENRDQWLAANRYDGKRVSRAQWKLVADTIRAELIARELA